MTTKIINGHYVGAYYLHAPTTELIVGPTGYIAGDAKYGIHTPTTATTAAYTVVNEGTVFGGRAAVLLYGGGTITNGTSSDTTALIEGPGGVLMGGPGVVRNFATIRVGHPNPGLYSAVIMDSGGAVTNGSATDTAALIEGYDGGVAALNAPLSVTNFGTITATSAGILVNGGSLSLSNGTTTDTAALISGNNGVVALGPATIKNFATIKGLSGDGVNPEFAASITNGSANDTKALISGVLDGVAGGSPDTITNFGTITASAVGKYDAGVLLTGGLVSNGTSASTAAYIEGDTGVRIGSDGTVLNQATIVGAAYGVYLDGGGSLTNGAIKNTAAEIYAPNGAVMTGGPGTIRNFGAIGNGSNPGIGVYLHDGGSVTNGYKGEPLTSGNIIVGYTTGIVIAGAAGTVTNYAFVDASLQSNGATYGVDLRAGGQVSNRADGDIWGGTAISVEGATGTVTNLGFVLGGSGYGVDLHAGGKLTNGSSSDHFATIISGSGVYLSSGTVDNFGTIIASQTGYKAVYAVKLGSAASVLIVEAVSALEGAVSGGGGTLELACGAGTVSSIGGGAIDASGSFLALGFANFGALDIAKGSAFTLTGAGTIAAGGVATLEIDGTLRDAGTLDVSGTLAGGGVLQVVAGAQVNVDVSLGYAGRWDQTGGTVTTASGATLTLSGAGDTFTGTLAGAGTIAITGSGDTFRNVDLAAAAIDITATKATLAGTVGLASLVSLTCPDLVVSGVIAHLTGGGTLKLSNHASNKIVGAAATSLLDNADKIEGAGQLGAGTLRLTNEATGIIDASSSAGMTIDTGAYGVVNHGLIEASGAGSLLIKSAVSNGGTLGALGGDLTVEGAVTGGGIVKIIAATAAFAGPFGEAVSFGSSGELVLAQSTAYAGTISHFSLTGTTSLDLEDIAFGGTTTASYSGTTASGVLTVSDGAHTAHIHLAGNFTASTFTLSSDGHGGTTVVDPPKIGATPLIIAAMAGFAPRPAGLGARSSGLGRADPSMILAVRAA